MSLAQIKQEIAKLTPEELDHLQAAIHALRKPDKVVATPEMLARRREISQKFLSGEWSVDLPSYEEMKAEARRKDPWNS
jgi:hypothetical protein